MARRSKPKEDRNNLFTDDQLSTVTSKVNTMAHNYAAMMLTKPMQVNEVIDAMFDPDTVRRATMARGIIPPMSDSLSYTVGNEISLGIDYTKAQAAPIVQTKLAIQPSFAPMQQFIEEARRVYLKFEEIKAMIRYFNKHATAGAVRAYWPPIMEVARHTPAFRDMDKLPSRYSEPRDIARWLQVLRDATTTMAEVNLLPGDTVARPRQEIWLTFGSVDVLKGNMTYRSDYTTFNF
jgi:hypothetical protein